jgi:amino acid adenylation domain-containing protein
MGPHVPHVQSESGLSYSQLPIWIGQQRTPDSPLYNMTFAFVFEGALDAEVFRAAWRRTIERSDALRTSVVERGGAAVRRCGDPHDYETAVDDFSAHADPETRFRVWARERCARVLPTNGPLVDSVLVRLRADLWGWYLNQHHLVTDAASTVALFREVADVYASAASSGVARANRPSYYTTIDRLAAYPPAGARASASAHWRERLALADRTVPFYGERARAASTCSERLTVVLADEASRRIRALATEPGFVSLLPDISLFSIFATLLTAWCHRVSGAPVVSFDTLAHGRATPAARIALGPFIERFPFTVSIGTGESFRSLGAKCLNETLAFLRHALPATGGSAGANASNVVLNYVSRSFGDFAGIAVRSEWMHSGHGDRVHAVRLQVHDFDATGRYTLHFDVNEETFTPARRLRLVAHFQRLLDAFLADVDASIGGIDVLTAEERDSLILRFNATDARPLPTASVVERFDRQAARTPEGVALRQGERVATFASLQREVAAVAERLVQLGVEPGTRVAVCMTRSFGAVTAILAILKARGAYVPIDPAYPAARVAHILEDSGAALVIGRGDAAAQLPASRPPLVSIEQLRAAGRQPGAMPIELPAIDDFAYVIYTSGSTGAPKGVPIEHGGLADYLEWAERTYVRGDRLTFPLFTSLAFDLTLTSLFLPLVTGGTLAIYEEPHGPVDTGLVDVVRDNVADFIKLTPSHLSLMRQMDLSTSRIRRMVVGGEDFATHLAAAAHAQMHGQVEIYNEYGPTEAVVGCAVHRYAPASDAVASVPIGRPADHVQLYVLNEALMPVPEGVPGELCISRFGLARGYHGRPDLTGHQFVRHPFREGDRLYRTGDLARFIAPDTLTYLGRADRQLKVSGIRVEPAEIEAALLAHDAVSACIVTEYKPHPLHAATVLLDACLRCGIAANVPGVTMAADGVCSVCLSFDAVRTHAQAYFGNMDDLKAIVSEAAAARRGRHDCMLLLSGGKDSTYALGQLVEMGVTVYAFTLDNGYLSDQARANIRRVVDTLGVQHEFATTPAMNAIFRDSLERFSNVCNGCFKALYTLSVTRARELGIPVIVTGLSRGQFFETRLTENLFRNGRCSPAEVDAAVLAARKAYHRMDDAVSRSLDVSMFQDDRVFEEIRFVDFYRYCDAGLDEVLSYLQRTLPWVRPSDTGRSTNCLINDVGIYVHQRERGYHNYALPYSWDVRLGHKTRDEALQELGDEIDTPRVRKILKEIDYDEKRLAASATLVGYYVASREVSAAELRAHLAARLPAPLLPQHFVRLEAVPLTENGKVDFTALPPPPARTAPPDGERTAPAGAAQERIAAIWRDVLRVDRVDASATFFELGGTSIGAMEVILRICDAFDVDLPLQTVFQRPTVPLLAEAVEAAIALEIAQLTDEEAEGLAGSGSPA